MPRSFNTPIETATTSYEDEPQGASLSSLLKNTIFTPDQNRITLVEIKATINKYQGNDKNKPRFSFKPDNPDHIKLISQCKDLLLQKLNDLHAIDIKMLAGFTVGVAAFALSWLLPFTAVAIAGFAYGAYQLGVRQHAYKEYSDTLETLKDICNWTLNDSNMQVEALNQTMKNQTICEMAEVLTTLMNEEQLRAVIRDDIEEVYVNQAHQNDEEDVRVQGYKLLDATQTKNLKFAVYGMEQGGILDILQGLGHAIQNAVKALFNMIRGHDASPAQAQNEEQQQGTPQPSNMTAQDPTNSTTIRA